MKTVAILISFLLLVSCTTTTSGEKECIYPGTKIDDFHNGLIEVTCLCNQGKQRFVVIPTEYYHDMAANLPGPKKVSLIKIDGVHWYVYKYSAITEK